jgi:hypothetical protein
MAPVPANVAEPLMTTVLPLRCSLCHVTPSLLEVFIDSTSILPQLMRRVLPQDGSNHALGRSAQRTDAQGAFRDEHSKHRRIEGIIA